MLIFLWHSFDKKHSPNWGGGTLCSNWIWHFFKVKICPTWFERICVFFSGKSSLWLARWSVYHWYIKILWNRSFLGRPVLRYSLLKFVFYLISRSEWSPWKYYRKEEKDKNSNNKKVTKVSVCSVRFSDVGQSDISIVSIVSSVCKIGHPANF